MSDKRSFRSSIGNNKPNMPDMSKLPNEKDMPPEQKQQMQQIKNIAEKYKDKSEAEIMQEIGAMATKGRANGMLNDKQIDAFKDKLFPMLDAAQKKKLESVINTIKKK